MAPDDLANDRPIDRLDIGIGIAVLLLLLAIGLTVALGDQAGIGVVSAAPGPTAHTLSLVRVTFSEPMKAETVEARFSIAPPLPGKFAWSGAQLTFRPAGPLVPGKAYTVTVRAGAESAEGRRLLQDVSLSFRVVPPQVIFIAPAVRAENAGAPNLWAVDPANPFVTRQLTFSEYGVLDYAPGPDGSQIVYAQRANDGTADLYLLNVDNGAIQRLTNCVKALCQSPDWSPDGSRIVYERVESNAALKELDQGAPRAWILNLRDLTTAPLFADSQSLGGVPRWSPDGRQIATYDRNLGAIVVYDLVTGDRKLIRTLEGETGAFAFSPDGSQFVYPEMMATSGRFFMELSLADLANPQNGIRSLSGRDAPPVEDNSPAWNPDGKRLAITRRYLDQRATNGAQVYLIDPATTEAQPLVVDDNYFHGAIHWDPAGERLVIQRLPYGTPEPEPGIWVYEVSTKRLWQVAKDAFLPNWLP